MKKISRFWLNLFLIMYLILLLCVYINAKYDCFIIKPTNTHTLVSEGTLVIFDKQSVNDVKPYDIIKTTNGKIVRFLSKNEQENMEIVSDDFGVEKETISFEKCESKLIMHFNEIGNLWNDYLKKNKQLIFSFPFVFLIISFIFLPLHYQKIFKENMDFNIDIDKDKIIEYRKFNCTKSITNQCIALVETTYHEKNNFVIKKQKFEI